MASERCEFDLVSRFPLKPPLDVNVHQDDVGPHEFGRLYLKWMGVLDNCEGSGGFHGPKGNIHVVTHDGDFPEGGHSNNEVIIGQTEHEWDDGDEAFGPIPNGWEIFRWRVSGRQNRCLVLRIRSVSEARLPLLSNNPSQGNNGRFAGCIVSLLI